MARLDREPIEKYRALSLGLADPVLLSSLRGSFKRKYTLEELLRWMHERVRFDKGDIERHNDPRKILAYGRGCCGEFSILFVSLCLAHGYSARLILDMSDHVWTEVWCGSGKGWVHVDPSEKRIDDPFMYERDWKKNLTEIYAFENGKMENVTEKYKIAKDKGDCQFKKQH